MQNNLNPPIGKDVSRIVYKTQCISGDCALQQPYYIGHTQCTINQRMANHAQSGSIKEHHINCHSSELSKDELIASSSILYRSTDARELKTYEALAINSLNPGINKQQDKFMITLKLFPIAIHNENRSIQQAETSVISAPSIIRRSSSIELHNNQNIESDTPQLNAISNARVTRSQTRYFLRSTQ